MVVLDGLAALRFFFYPSFLSHGIGMLACQTKKKYVLSFYFIFNYSPYFFY